MKSKKSLETAGFAGIATLFLTAFFICTNILHEVVNFVMQLPVNNFQH